MSCEEGVSIIHLWIIQGQIHELPLKSRLFSKMRQNPRFLSNKAPFHCTACIRNEIINFNQTKQNRFSERENVSNQAGQSWRSVLVNVVIVQPGNLVPHKFLFSLCFSIFILFYYYFAFLFSVSGIDKEKGTWNACWEHLTTSIKYHYIWG